MQLPRVLGLQILKISWWFSVQGFEFRAVILDLVVCLSCDRCDGQAQL